MPQIQLCVRCTNAQVIGTPSSQRGEMHACRFRYMVTAGLRWELTAKCATCLEMASCAAADRSEPASTFLPARMLATDASVAAQTMGTATSLAAALNRPYPNSVWKWLLTMQSAFCELVQAAEALSVTVGLHPRTSRLFSATPSRGCWSASSFSALRHSPSRMDCSTSHMTCTHFIVVSCA
jgi:hypothetical protein